MSLDKSNKKSLKNSKKKSLSRKEEASKDFIASDIMAKLQLGVPELEIFAELVEQAIPMEEIQSAFGKLGYDQDKFSSLSSAYEEAMRKQQSPQMPDFAAVPQMQFGGGNIAFPLNISQGNRMKGSDFVPARGVYLPQDLRNRGNVLGAAATAAEAVGNLFSGQDRDGDGLMDGAFRDTKAKRRAFKRGKYDKFKYTDNEGNPIEGFSSEELNKAYKDPSYTPRSQAELLADYSRFGTNEQGGLEAFITDRPFDKRDFTRKGRLKNFFMDDKVETPEELYGRLTPAREFDFNPFVEKAKKEIEEKKKAVAATTASQSTATQSATQSNNPVVQSNTPVFDRTDIYNQIMDFEAKGGKYDPVQGAIPHGSFGNNIYSFTDDKGVAISTTDPRYRTMLADKMEEVYGKDLAGFKPEAQGAMIDFGYSTGNDPRIYLLDQYMKEQGLGDLPGRSDYNLHMDKYEWDDPTYKKQFETEYNKYSDKINALTGPEQLRLMNQGRRFYYDNINRVTNPKYNPNDPTSTKTLANPAAAAVWLQRPFYKTGGDLLKYQVGNEFEDKDGDNIPDSIDIDGGTGTGQTLDTFEVETDRIEIPTLPIQGFNLPQPNLELRGLDEANAAGFNLTGGVNREKIKGAGMRRFLESPGIDMYGTAATAGVALAGVANEMFTNSRAFEARENLRNTTADDLYGTYEEREGDRGMWDVNTGLAQPDNLDIGYAMHGKEFYKKQDNIVDVDMETITKLIAAGADIQIL